MPWTDEMVESLKKMWDEGLSTGEIGKRLGVSKNSIVGKVHRLQLVARPSPIKKKDAETTPKAAKEKLFEYRKNNHINHDIDDAIRAGIISINDIPNLKIYLEK